MSRRLIRTAVAAVLVLGLLGAACGDDGGGAAPSTGDLGSTSAATDPPEASGSIPAGSAGGSTTGSSAFPVTVSTPSGPLTLDQRPERIVSLSPTATESLFAIGAGSQVVAVDDQSTYPPEAPRTKLSGIDANIEAIAAYDPDLVVISYDPGGLVDSLAEVELPVLVQPAARTLDDVAVQIRQLGDVTGRRAGAEEVAAEVESGIDAIVERTPSAEGQTYYYELDDSYFSATSTSFIGQLFATLGLSSVADPADPDGTAGGYPQLSAEYILKADPDFVFLADTKCCGQSAATVSARPGWSGLIAVTSGRVVELDDDLASRWGPRVVQLLQAVADSVGASTAQG